jgi:hypothetical protein
MLERMGKREMKKREKLALFNEWNKQYEANLSSYLNIEDDDDSIVQLKKDILFEKLSEINELLLNDIVYYIETSNLFLKRSVSFEDKDLELYENYIKEYWNLTHLSSYIEEELEKNLKKTRNDLNSFLKHTAEKKIKSLDGIKKYKEYEFNNRV